MTSPFLRSISVFALILPIFCQAQQSHPGSEPLIPGISGFHGDIGLRYQTDRRAIDGFPEGADRTFGSSPLGNPIEVDFEQILLRFSAHPHPALSLHAEGGWSEAELEGEKAGGDLIWGVGGRLNVLEKVLKGSAEQTKKEVLRLSLEVNYRSTEGEFNSDTTDGATLEFEELEVIPLFTYERNNDLNLDRSAYAPPGSAAHVGVVFNSIDASLAEFDLEEKEAASLLLGFDLRWKTGWSTQVRAIISSDSDRRIGLGASYNF